MEERHLKVHRTARYHLLGDLYKAQEIWVVVHGYGQLARFFLNKFEGLARERIIVAPEGLSRFYLDAQHERVGATWMTREDRLREIEDHVAYLDHLAQTLRREAGQDLPVHALGFSQGVATVARWSLKGTTRPQHLVFWAGGLPPELDHTTMRPWRTCRIDLVLGDADEYASPGDLDAMAQRLESGGIKALKHRFAGSHRLDPVLLERLLNRR